MTPGVRTQAFSWKPQSQAPDTSECTEVRQVCHARFNSLPVSFGDITGLWAPYRLSLSVFLAHLTQEYITLRDLQVIQTFLQKGLVFRVTVDS